MQAGSKHRAAETRGRCVTACCSTVGDELWSVDRPASGERGLTKIRADRLDNNGNQQAERNIIKGRRHTNKTACLRQIQTQTLQTSTWSEDRTLYGLAPLWSGAVSERLYYLQNVSRRHTDWKSNRKNVGCEATQQPWVAAKINIFKINLVYFDIFILSEPNTSYHSFQSRLIQPLIKTLDWPFKKAK